MKLKSIAKPGMSDYDILENGQLKCKICSAEIDTGLCSLIKHMDACCGIEMPSMTYGEALQYVKDKIYK